MNILGIGGMELIFILIIMLVVAGPKRMMQWAYVLGVYMGKLRGMWAETSRYLQQEFDAAGVDVKVPTEIPTRQSINRSITKALDPVTKPVQETLNEIDADSKRVRSATSLTPKPKPTTPVENGSMGAWSQARGGNGQNAENGGTASASGDSEFGAWGSAGKTDE